LRFSRLSSRTAAVAATALLIPLALWAASPLVSQGATEQQLNDRIAGQKARERQLDSAADRLAALEQDLTNDISVLEQRLAGVRGDLADAQGRLGDLQVRLRDERIATSVRDARAQARAEAVRLATLEDRQRDTVLAVQRRQDALEGMNAALQSRRASLARARATREAALADTRTSRRQAERELDHLIAEREKAAVSSAGPGGPWAIPWAIVQCESGGQNLPPNWAGASGYYQFMPATWQGLGGSTPDAYLASKAEQDRLAARLWNNGAGADNWDCAALVA
jgi:hypothetical protein